MVRRSDIRVGWLDSHEGVELDWNRPSAKIPEILWFVALRAPGNDWIRMGTGHNEGSGGNRYSRKPGEIFGGLRTAFQLSW